MSVIFRFFFLLLFTCTFVFRHSRLNAALCCRTLSVCCLGAFKFASFKPEIRYIYAAQICPATASYVHVPQRYRRNEALWRATLSTAVPGIRLPPPSCSTSKQNVCYLIWPEY